MANDLPQVGAEVVLEHADYDKAIDAAISKADDFDTRLNDLGGTINTTIDVDSSALTDLEDTQVEVGITVDDSELPFDEIPETTETAVNITETEEAQTASDDLHFMANLKRIETVINIAGNVLDVVEKIGGLVVTPFLDVEDAVARINAQTGGTGIDDLGQFIRDIQAADLGDSVDQISDVVIAAKQLGAPIDEATTAALTFTHTFKDQDPVTVMTTLKTLSDQFGVSMQSAADIMTVAFQEGMNRGGDLLGVVNANSQSWQDMGLTETQAFSVLDSLMKGGIDNATDAAKAMQALDDAATIAAANPNSPQADAFKAMGLENPKEKGQAVGSDFFNGFAASFQNLPSDQQDLISGQLVGKVGKKFTGALGEMSTEGGPFADMVGAAADAATEIDNSLRGAIDDFMTEVNAKVAEVLSSDAIDLPGKIEALKKGLQDALDVLVKGGSIGEALEVGLKIKGVDTFISNFERIVGNLEIAFLQIVAVLQDITGHGKEAEATRKTIAVQSQNQLTFDLQLANPEEVGAMIQQAASRGLSGSNMAFSIDKALDESIANAKFDQGANIIQGLIQSAQDAGQDPAVWNELATKYVGQLGDGFDNALAAGNIDLLQKMIAIPPNAKIPGLDDAVAGFQKQLSDAFEPKGNTDTSFDAFTSGIMAPGGPGKTGATGGGLLGGLTDQMDAAVAKVTDTDNALGISSSHIATSFDTMSTEVGTSLEAVQTNVDATATSVDELDAHIATATTDNTITASFDAVLASAEANFPGVISWFQQTAAEAAVFDSILGVHLRSVMKQLNDVNFLALQTIANVTSAKALGGSGPVTNNTTTTVNVTNNNSNGAQTSNSDYTLSQSLGGG